MRLLSTAVVFFGKVWPLFYFFLSSPAMSVTVAATFKIYDADGTRVFGDLIIRKSGRETQRIFLSSDKIKRIIVDCTQDTTIEFQPTTQIHIALESIFCPMYPAAVIHLQVKKRDLR